MRGGRTQANELVQLELPVGSRRGGHRPGAGRKPRDPNARSSTPHRPRGQPGRGHPVHVTVRTLAGLPRLRADAPFDALVDAIRKSQRDDSRVVHFSVQHDHVHLLVEADDGAALSRGMSGFAIRAARALNRVFGRAGRLWGDRWNGRALRSPREVRNALAYLLFNARKHGELGFGLDGYASTPWAAACFEDDTYREGLALLVEARVSPVHLPRTWLLGHGWKRRGLLRWQDAAAIERRGRTERTRRRI